MRKYTLALFLFGAVAAARADVTMRQTMDLKSSALPPEAMAMMQQQMGFSFPLESTMRLKGDVSYYHLANFNFISNLATNQVTLLDLKKKQFAALAFADYLSKLKPSQPMPPEVQKQIENMKFDVQSIPGEKNERVQGIEIEDHASALTLAIPIPGQASGAQIRVEVHMWSPTAAELQRTPALRELADYSARAKNIYNPLMILQQMMGGMPGMSSQMSGFMDKLSAQGGPPLRFRMEMSMPGLADMLKQMPPGGQQPPAALLAGGPLFAVTSDLLEISGASIADADMRIPEGFTEAPMEELIQGIMPAAGRAKPKQ